MNLWGFLSRELWFFLLLGILLGLAVPQIGLYVTPYAIYFLLVVMFFTSLEISFFDIKDSFQNKKYILTSLVLVFLVSPTIAFLISFLLEPNLALGLILYSAIPSAMASAFYMKRMKKNAAMVLVITTVTTLLSPIMTPLIVEFFSGYFIQINPFDLFISLLKLIVLPFIAAELVRRYSSSLAEKILEVSPPINNIAIFFVVFGVLSASAGQIWSYGFLAAVVFLFFIICFSLGYLFGGEYRIETAFNNGFRNSTLAMVVALDVFGMGVAIVGVMANLVHNSVLVLLMLLKDKKKF